MRLAARRLKRWISGRITTSRLLRLRTRDLESLLYRAQSELQNGRFDAAFRLFQLGTTLWPDEQRIFLGLGVAHQALGDHEAAATAFTKALALAPDDPWALVNRAEVRLLQGRPDEARQDLDRLTAPAVANKVPSLLQPRVAQIARLLNDRSTIA